MLKNKYFLLGIGLFLSFLLVLSVSNFWHSITPEYVTESLQLNSFDKKNDSNVCFSGTYVSQEKQELDFLVLFEGSVVLNEKVEFLKGDNDFSRCLTLEKSGRVEIKVNKLNVFFNYSKEKADDDANVLASIKDYKLEITFSGEIDKVEPIKVFVNDELVKNIYPTKKNQVFLEKIDWKDGENSVLVEYSDKKKTLNHTYSAPFKMNSLIGIILLVLLIVICVLIVGKESLLENISSSFALLFGILILISFVLNYTNSLSIETFFGVLIFIIAGLTLFFRKKILKQIDDKINLKKIWNKEKWLIITSLFVLFIGISFHLFSTTHFTNWNVYYERQSASIAENFDIHLLDEKVEFGKTFAFPAGYFLIEASVSWLTGLEGQLLFALIVFISQIFLIFSSVNFSKSFGLTERESSLFLIFIMASNFVFLNFLFSPRHIISLGMVFIALARLFRGKLGFVTGGLLGIIGYIQTPMLLFTVVFYLLFNKDKKSVFETIKTGVIGFVTFAVLYIPIILQFGMPYQIKSEGWGYLITLGIDSLVAEMGFFLFLVFLVLIYFFVRRKIVIQKEHYILFIVLGLSIIIQMFVSFRWNVFTTTVAGLVFGLYAGELLKKRIWKIAFVVFVLVGFLFVSHFKITLDTSKDIGSLDYLRENSFDEARVLPNPRYSHKIAYISEKAVLADLQVEYASEEKLNDTYLFLKTKDKNILDKYDIDYVFSDNSKINEVVNSIEEDKVIEFEELDKIYHDRITNVSLYIRD